MVIEFSNIDLKERPVLVLRSVDGTAIQTLGYAYNINLSLFYNEASTLEFEVPAYVDGIKTPNYDKIVGMMVVDMVGYGQFILVNPKVNKDGIRETKSCKAYSLEYELTFKKMSLPEDTYNFYNSVAKDNTILGIIESYLPSWEIGTVSADLIGKYRTFSAENVNVYNFIKSTVQQTYGCIFDFDTYRRKINVRSTDSKVTPAEVYLSLNNLAKEIELEEDTENIFTCLDVHGADGVDISSVNPLGNNKIYNFDYFMHAGMFPDGMAEKWEEWQANLEANQTYFYNLSVQLALKNAQILTENATLSDMKGTQLADLENQKAVAIEYLATLDKNDPNYETERATFQQKLNDLNAKIEALTNPTDGTITQQNGKVTGLTAEKEAIIAELADISQEVALENTFYGEELKWLDRYTKEDSIEDSTFVYKNVDSYVDESTNITVDNTMVKLDGSVVVNILGQSSALYTMRGGNVTIDTGDDTITAALIRGSVERHTDGSFVLSLYLDSGEAGGKGFGGGTLSMTGSCGTISDNCVPDADAPNAYETGSSMNFTVSSARLFLTHDTTAFEQYAVQWDLMEYAEGVLRRLAYPSYSFDVDAANFFTLDEFRSFVSSIALGSSIYLDMGDGEVLEPIFIGAEFDFEDIGDLKLHFGDKYSLSDSKFSLVDLLEQSVSMGKTVSLNQIKYSAFTDSGASTSVRNFMTSALDASKNAILSATGQAVSWDAGGIRCRKLLEDGSYDEHQIAIINNTICFTEDNWETVNLAIGKIGDHSGIIADHIIGTLLAGENLVIECIKKDGGISTFRVDGDGAVLYNAQFDVKNAKTHIVLDPNIGFAIGDNSVTEVSTYADGQTVRVLNEDNAKFWVDTDGNLHFKGKLHGCDGEFSGKLSAGISIDSPVITGGSIKIGKQSDDSYAFTVDSTGKLNIGGGNFIVTPEGEVTAESGRFKGNITADTLTGKLTGELTSNGNGWIVGAGLKIGENSAATNGYNFYVDTSGNLSMQGNITLGGNINLNGAISWGSNTDPSQVALEAKEIAEQAKGTADDANSVIDQWSAYTYEGKTYIDAEMLATDTVIASKLIGGTVKLLSSSEAEIGGINIGRHSNGYGLDLYTNDGGIRLLPKGNLYIAAYTESIDNYGAVESTGAAITVDNYAVTFPGSAVVFERGYSWGTADERPNTNRVGHVYFEI